jgi:hypothetical protein
LPKIWDIHAKIGSLAVARVWLKHKQKQQHGNPTSISLDISQVSGLLFLGLFLIVVYIFCVMTDPASPAKRFANYPLAVEAPKIPYTKDDDANPVFSGRILAIGAWLYVSHRRVTGLGLIQIVSPSFHQPKDIYGPMPASTR